MVRTIRLSNNDMALEQDYRKIDQVMILIRIHLSDT